MHSDPDGLDAGLSRGENLAELFPAGDYRFHLTLRRGEPREFFGPHDASGRALAERARWLAADPARHAALTPEGEPLLDEFGKMCAGWNVAASASEWSARPLAYARSYEKLLALGTALEPDILLLSPDPTGTFRLRGGRAVTY